MHSKGSRDPIAENQIPVHEWLHNVHKIHWLNHLYTFLPSQTLFCNKDLPALKMDLEAGGLERGKMEAANLERAVGDAISPSKGRICQAGQTLNGCLPDPRASSGHRAHHAAYSLGPQHLFMGSGNRGHARQQAGCKLICLGIVC